MKQKEIMKELLNLINKIHGTSIEMDEEFIIEGSEGIKCKITEESFCVEGPIKERIYGSLDLFLILSENRKIKQMSFKPKFNQGYFTPSIFSEEKYWAQAWINSKFDIECLEKNLVCRTPEQAIELHDKMLNSIK